MSQMSLPRDRAQGEGAPERVVRPDRLTIERSSAVVGGVRASHVLTCESTVRRPLEEVFAFFADARNLEAITPPLLRFEVLTPEPIEMREGLILDYRLKVRGVPIRWRTEIPTWEPPVRFVDRALRSPYALWHHEHTFIPRADGTTAVKDVVHYRPIGGALAPLVHALFVKRDLMKIFAYRTARIGEVFGE
ncbi:MAG: SRPBCC family protein [Phycisphaerales bacterium JB040]